MIIRMNSRFDKDGTIVVPGVSDRVGLHPVVIRRMVRNNKFPKPVPLGPRAKGWIDDELLCWEEERRKERDASLEAKRREHDEEIKVKLRQERDASHAEDAA